MSHAEFHPTIQHTPQPISDVEVRTSTALEVLTDFPAPATITVEQDPVVPGLFESIRSDIRESRKPVKTVALGALALATQIPDRIRLIAILAPPAAIEVMNHTQNPILAALAAAGIYAGFNFSNGEALTQALAAYPKTLDSFDRKFPAVVKVFEQSLPGVMNNSETVQGTTDLIQPSKTRRVSQFVGRCLRKAGKHVRGWGTSIGMGSTAFVATASVKGRSVSEVRKLNAGVTYNGSVGVFSIAAGLTGGLKELAQRGQYELADNISDFVGDTKLWLGLAACSMAAEYRVNRKKARELATELKANEATIYILETVDESNS